MIGWSIKICVRLVIFEVSLCFSVMLVVILKYLLSVCDKLLELYIYVKAVAFALMPAIVLALFSLYIVYTFSFAM